MKVSPLWCTVRAGDGGTLRDVSRPTSAALSIMVLWGAAALSLMLVSACAGTPTATPARSPDTTRVRPADGAEMVLVPAGEFLMGSTDADPKAGADEMPAHTVYLDAFWIDVTEVTNARYVRFLGALGEYRSACGGQDCLETKREDPDSRIVYQDGRFVVESGYEDQPVVEVTWFGAQAYCQWAGARLPTEAEWEKAARGTDGRRYPWGSDAPDCGRAQFAGCGGTTAPAGSRPAGASPYGALDMAGNAWEWVADWYDAAYYNSSPALNPEGPEAGERRAFRGGSWGYPATFIRTTDRARNRPAYAGPNLGFRCSLSTPAGGEAGTTP